MGIEGGRTSTKLSQNFNFIQDTCRCFKIAYYNVISTFKADDPMDGNETLSEKRDKADESWADFVRKGKYFYRDHLTAPAFLQLLGCVREKEMLDLACDEGVNARLLARKGAKVTAVDFSRKLKALAIQRDKKKRH